MTSEELAELVTALGEYTCDPLGWVYFAFPWGEGELADYPGPDKWQVDILQAVGKGTLKPEEAVRIAVASGHGIGKSALVAWIVLWAVATFEDTRVVVTANTETQLRTKTWAELAKWYRLFIGRELFVFTATALFSAQKEHAKTWRADMVPWSETNPEAFAGLHNRGKRILVVFDEASAIADRIWEVTEGALTDRDTQIVWCCFGNPTRNSGRFFDCFHRERHRWVRRQIDSRTASMTNISVINEWIEDRGLDSDFIRVRVLGQFPTASETQFISGALVEAAQNVLLRKEQTRGEPVIIGVDPAWTGADEFVIFLRQGLFCKVLAHYAKNDDDLHMAGIIAQLEDEYKAAAVNIDKGYGTGIYSAGKGLGRNWALIEFAGRPNDDQYENKRAEMWGEMKQWLLDGGALPKDDNVLRDDLVAPEVFINRRGKLQLESKQDMKKRGVASPNRADALALTFARRVAPVHTARARSANSGYDLFKV